MARFARVRFAWFRSELRRFALRRKQLDNRARSSFQFDHLGLAHGRGGLRLRLPDFARARRHEHALAQVNAGEIGAHQRGVAHGDATHIGIRQSSPGEIDSSQIGTEQVGVPQVGTDHPTAVQASPAEIGFGQLAAGEVEAGQVAEFEVGALTTRPSCHERPMCHEDRLERVDAHGAQFVRIG